jgi:Transposase
LLGASREAKICTFIIIDPTFARFAQGGVRGVSYSRIHPDIIQKYTGSRSVSNRSGRDRKEVTLARQKYLIVRLVQVNRRIFAVSISVSSPSLIGTKINISTISKILNKTGLFSRVAQKKPLLTKTHSEKIKMGT